jgi:hypothetical protein
MKAIITIQTVTGPKSITGEKIGEHLAITKKGAKYSVTHIASGYAVAWFTCEADARSIATVLSFSKADFSWENASQMPAETKDAVHALFLVLSKSIKFTAQP